MTATYKVMFLCKKIRPRLNKQAPTASTWKNYSCLFRKCKFNRKFISMHLQSTKH